jgi:vitamin B12 transporter
MKKIINFTIIIFLIYAINMLFSNYQLTAQDAPIDKESAVETSKEDTESDQQKENKAIKLNTIVITATRTKEKQKDVPVNVDVITSKDIEATGADTLGDVIGQKITGHYHRYSGLSQPAGLMGNLGANSMGDHTSDRVVVLADGHNIGTGNLAKIPPEIIERVEVIKGPASALYGSAAMGGVINVITKKGASKVQNSAKLETGSFDYSRAALTSEGSINDYTNYFVTTSFEHIDDYKTKKYGTAYNSNQEQAHLWGNLSIYPSNDQSLRFGFSYADLTAHYPEWQSNSQYTYYDKNKNQYSEVGRGHADLEYNLAMLNSKLNWKAVVYELWDRRSWYSGSSGRAEDDASIYNDYTTGTDQQIEIALIPNNKIVAGYTFELLKRDAQTKKSGITVTNSTPDFNYYTNAAYIQDTVSLFHDSLIITGGTRYDRFDLATDGSGTNSKDVSFNNVSPRGGVVYKILDISRIRGNIGRAFRAPNADELTMYNPTSYGIYAGNPDMKPETSTTYDAGFDFYPGFINFGATYSFIKAKNLITYKYSYTDGGGKKWYIYENVNNSKMEIIDCYLKISSGKLSNLPLELNLSSNITFNKKYENTDTGNKLPFVADREVKSGIETIYKTLRVTLSHVYVGHEILNTGDKKVSFYFFNLTSGYEISPIISAEIEIFNLTNKDYEWVKGYPAAERNYKIGLTGKF